MKKKILFVVTKSNFGGAQRYVYDLATNLPRESFDVVVAFGGEGVLAQMLAKKNIRNVSVPSLARDVNILGDITALFALIKLFRKERPDVVHLNSSKAGGLGALAARLAGVPRIVFTSHGLAYDEDRRVVQKSLIYIATLATFLLCHAVICISKDTMTRAKNTWWMQNKIHLVYNGIPEFQMLSKEDARASLEAIINISIPKDALWIATISELVRNKGLSYAIDACALLKQSGQKFVFLIIGDGDLHDALAHQIKKQNLTDNVYLLGFVPDARKYMKAFDVFTLTSVKEGLPYVILEAAQAQVAIVGSNIPGIRDIVEHEVTGLLVPPRNTGTLADALIRISTDTSLRERLAHTLHERVATTFSLHNTVNNTVDIC